MPRSISAVHARASAAVSAPTSVLVKTTRLPSGEIWTPPLAIRFARGPT
jgi:hypothetical protein